MQSPPDGRGALILGLRGARGALLIAKVEGRGNEKDGENAVSEFEAGQELEERSREEKRRAEELVSNGEKVTPRPDALCLESQKREKPLGGEHDGEERVEGRARTFSEITFLRKSGGGGTGLFSAFLVARLQCRVD